MTATQQRTASPRRRQRQRPQARRRGGGGSKLLNALIGLAFAGGAVGIQAMALTADDMATPLTYVGNKGQDVSAGRFSVRVKSVQSAKAIKTKDKTVETDQLFLVIGVEATVPKEPLHIKAPTLLSEDGIKYVASDRIDKGLTLSNNWVQPGWWVAGSFVFEVPASALSGARALFMEDRGLGGALYGDPVQPEAEVDLGIDAAQAGQLATAPHDVYPLGEK